MLVLLAASLSGCAGPTLTGSASDGLVIRHMAMADDADSLQTRADGACGKDGLKAHFSRYAEEDTLLGPRNAYFYCVTP
jgi:hypothetical protein